MGNPAVRGTIQSQPESTPTGTAGASGKSARDKQQSGVRLKFGWKITGLVVVVMTVLAVVNIIFTQNRFSTIMNREFES